MRRQTLAFCSLVLAAAVAGCGAPQHSDDFSDLNAGEKSDSFSRKMKLVGSLDYGQTSASTAYHNPPRYLAWKFAGQPGDVVDATVSSADGIPDAWILDNGFHVLQNEYGIDSSVTVEATLKANTNPDIHTYYVVVREDYLGDAHFTVQLSKKVNPIYACKVDSDCVAVFAEMCCPNGTKVAIHDGEESAYRAANKCTQPPHICPLYVINDTRVAECNRSTGACEMVKIENIQCGGFIANAHHCPAGYDCTYNPPGGDLPGTCTAAPKTCGGIAGLTCPSGQYCKYDTSVCDPANGGADCGGTCSVCIQNVLCTQNGHFDHDVCRCVPN